jgi:hypothetical protein
LEIIAAQKYGPPLVGYALQSSITGYHKRNTLEDREDMPAMLKQTNIVKNAFLMLGE